MHHIVFSILACSVILGINWVTQHALGKAADPLQVDFLPSSCWILSWRSQNPKTFLASITRN